MKEFLQATGAGSLCDTIAVDKIALFALRHICVKCVRMVQL